MSTEITIEQRVLLAIKYLSDIVAISDSVSPASNVFVGIGHNTEWPMGDLLIDPIVESTDYINQIFRELVAIKKLSISNSNLVVRRQDWVGGIVYDAYSESLPMFTQELTTNANGTVSTLVSQPTTTVIGTNTTFTTDFQPGSIIQLPGDGITVLSIQKEVVTIFSDLVLSVNTSYTQAYTANVPQLVTDTSPNYAYNFYVRNTYDQVFVCLSNDNETVSNVMPQISLGGQLPSDAYIITSDGYNWKYLYTIPSGLKQQYFTDEWMPISTDNNVLDSATNGRLDIINIVSGGVGYFNKVATFSAPILSVVGDGTGASLTAQVDANGTIYGINVLDAGSNYTTATILINDLPSSNGSGANIVVVIGPQGGWGSNVAFELGATNIMISLDLTDTEDGTIPIVDALGNYFSYRQIVTLKDPQLITGNGASALNYDMTTIVQVSSNTPFNMNDIVYQSNTGLIANATFIGTVVYFDNSTNEVHINNTTGTLLGQTQVYATSDANNTPYATVIAFSQTPSPIVPFSGLITYIENRTPVSRFPGQTENIKIVLEF